jgi:DNA ligase (NAD+)
MKKKEIQKYYNSKIKLIDEHNKFYYDKSRPKVSDDEYDQLKKEILLLEKKYDFLDSRNSPSKKIGYMPSKNFQKVPHKDSNVIVI